MPMWAGVQNRFPDTSYSSSFYLTLCFAFEMMAPLAPLLGRKAKYII